MLVTALQEEQDWCVVVSVVIYFVIPFPALVLTR